MESKIDFKGYKYVIIKRNGFHNRYTHSEVKVIEGGYLLDSYLYKKDNYDLHINPDYKEKEMKSDRLADEIMQKGKESVYTQEMFDNGEVPLVGITFICKEKTVDSRISDFLGKAVEVIGVNLFDGDEIITFRHEMMGIGCGRFGEEWVKPIDQRTDKEKATESLEFAIDNLEVFVKSNAKSLAISLIESISGSEFEHLSFTGDKK